VAIPCATIPRGHSQQRFRALQSRDRQGAGRPVSRRLAGVDLWQHGFIGTIQIGIVQEDLTEPAGMYKMENGELRQIEAAMDDARDAAAAGSR
jgi:hypothetical protein